MRVRGFSLARLRDEDQGAVLAIVAISLLVLLGMLVLIGKSIANDEDSRLMATALADDIGMLTPLFEPLPEATLGAIVIVAVLRRRIATFARLEDVDRIVVLGSR